MRTYPELLSHAIAVAQSAKSKELAILELDDICEQEGWLDCYGYTGSYLYQQAQSQITQATLQVQEVS